MPQGVHGVEILEDELIAVFLGHKAVVFRGAGVAMAQMVVAADGDAGLTEYLEHRFIPADVFAHPVAQLDHRADGLDGGVKVTGGL